MQPWRHLTVVRRPGLHLPSDFPSDSQAPEPLLSMNTAPSPALREIPPELGPQRGPPMPASLPGSTNAPGFASRTMSSTATAATPSAITWRTQPAAMGVLPALDQEKLPGCYYARSAATTWRASST